MTSLSGQEMPNSEPESLDSLDYDDWEGQFEFIGNNNNNNIHLTNHQTNDTDDLNLSAVHKSTNDNSVVLIDEMTFLTMQTNDDNDNDKTTSPSNLFNKMSMIDNVPLNVNKINNHNNNNRFLNSNEDHYINFDDIINLKNKLNSDKHNNNNIHINEIDTDLCDNLSEQVRTYVPHLMFTNQNFLCLFEWFFCYF